MAWGGLGVWLGALSWPLWQPSLEEAAGGVWLMGMLALLSRRHTTAILTWPVGAFLAGAVPGVVAGTGGAAGVRAQREAPAT